MVPSGRGLWWVWGSLLGHGAQKGRISDAYIQMDTKSCSGKILSTPTLPPSVLSTTSYLTLVDPSSCSVSSLVNLNIFFISRHQRFVCGWIQPDFNLRHWAFDGVVNLSILCDVSVGLAMGDIAIKLNFKIYLQAQKLLFRTRLERMGLWSILATRHQGFYYSFKRTHRVRQRVEVGIFSIPTTFLFYVKCGRIDLLCNRWTHFPIMWHMNDCSGYMG